MTDKQTLGEVARRVAETYVASYLAYRAQIAAIEVQAEEARKAIVECIGPDGAAPGTVWGFEGVGKVSVVKGRSSERLDRGRLARAGISAEVLDAATMRTEGKPSMRITAWEEPDAD